MAASRGIRPRAVSATWTGVSRSPARTSRSATMQAAATTISRGGPARAKGPGRPRARLEPRLASGVAITTLPGAILRRAPVLGAEQPASTDSALLRTRIRTEYGEPLREEDLR